MNTPHPNEIRNAQERQRLHCHGYGNAEPRPEDNEPIITTGGFHRVDCPCAACAQLSRTESACEQQKRDLGGNFTPDRIEANEDRWTDERFELMQIAYDREGLNEDGDPV